MDNLIQELKNHTYLFLKEIQEICSMVDVKIIEDRIRNDAPMFVDIQTFQT